MDMKIGDTVYYFDVNRRVYPSKKNGVAGPAIYRGHFRPVEIVSDTSRSWVTKFGDKIPKKTGESYHLNYFTKQGMEDNIWEKHHAYKISEMVRRSDANTLRKIAEIIGYETITE